MSENKLALTQAMLNSVPVPKDILDLPAVADNWARTYNKVSGRTDGVMRFEAEKVLFLQAISSNDKFKDCSRFSLYAAFTELAISGLSLRDGLTYIVPFKNTASFMVGWQGRLEQINEMPDVRYVHEPRVVYDCDDFRFHEDMTGLIIDGLTRGVRTKESKITHVYLVIDFTHGAKAYMMEAPDVLAIRDNYSKSYKDYVKKVEAGKFEPWMDLPMWVSDEAQAFKKTLVKRVYKSLPKLPKHKHLDQRMKVSAEQFGGEEMADPDEFNHKTKAPETPPATTLNEDDFTSFTEVVDEETGEVLNAPNEQSKEEDKDHF